MARLPTRDNLSGAPSLRSGRAIAQEDLSGIGRGISSLGGSMAQLGDSIRRQNTALQGTEADGKALQAASDFQRTFETDTDYDTFGKRAEAGLAKIGEQHANLIADPRARSVWLADWNRRTVAMRDSIIDLGTRKARDEMLTRGIEGLEGYQSVFADNKKTPEERDLAKRNAEASITLWEADGLISASKAQELRDTFIKGGDFILGQREIRDNPGILSDGFERSLVNRESGGRADVVNPWGYAGLYQFGAPRLADLGLYEPQGENLDGWSKRRGTTGKWTGTFNIPGFPEIRTLPDFLASPEAQKVAFAAHRRRMDDDIQRMGLQQYIGQTIGGVKITRDGIHAMMHLGGAGGAARTLRSGGADNATDANGTSLLEYARLGGSSADMPDWYTSQSPEDQLRLENYAATRRNAVNAETRGAIEVAVANAPTAILNTGRYDGAVPTIQQFMDAYGPADGAQKFNSFQATLETSEQAYAMRTMSAGDIREIVEAARPVSSGDNAVLETKRYETLTKAADATLSVRNSDPATYTMQAFPATAEAWQQAATTGDYQGAMAQMAAAQQQLGVADMRLLPKAVADQAISAFKDADRSEDERISSATSLIFATPDKAQRQAVFEQLVDAGLPEITEGAVEALARGDEGAARRLFRAAIVDPSKLPGASPETPARIADAIQSQLMDEGAVGDIYYGLRSGQVENYVRAERDQKLLTNAVQMRLRAGESLSAAVDAAAKDLFGDVQPVTSSWSVNAEILLPTGQDPDAVLDGMERALPTVREALERALTVPDSVPVSDGSRAVVAATAANYIDKVMAEGVFRNAGDGFAFINPDTGGAVADERGQPLIFSLQDLVSAGGADDEAPTSPEEDRQRSLDDFLSGPVRRDEQ